MIEIWHNPRCSKSRQTLALLEERNLDVTVRRYLDAPPDEAELRDALARLGMSANELIRKGDSRFKELGLTMDSPQEVLLEAMAAHPILIGRPIVFAHGKAAIGRPPEAVLNIL